MNPRALLRDHAALSARHGALVLCTVVATEGSTYARPGMRALVCPDGRLHGVVGGGCFDADVTLRAAEVRRTGEPQLLDYDLREDDAGPFGLGQGCAGRTRLLLQPVGAERTEEPLAALRRTVDEGRPRVLLTFIPAPPRRGAVRHLAIEDSVATQSFPAAEAALIARVRATGASAFVEAAGAEGMALYCERLEPPPALLVVGGGEDVAPLAALANLLEWEVTVYDPRDVAPDGARWPGAARIAAGLPEGLAELLGSGERWQAAVVMSHHFERDLRCLRVLAGTAVPFVGLLGPAARRDRLLAELGPAGAALRGRLHGPVGLDLGGRSAPEIALSALAQILARSRGASGGPLGTQTRGSVP